MTFFEWCEYYWGVTSDVTGELPLYWYERYEPIEDEE
jgi:hypothetical protein